MALTPDSPFAYYALAKVFFHRQRFPEAASAIEEAIRLDPYDADSFSLLAAIHMSTSAWKKALTAADAGLAIFWGLTAMVATTIHACQRGWPRWGTVAAVSVVASVMTASAVAAAAFGAAPEEVFERGGARLAATLFGPAWFLTMILSQVMTRQQVRH